VLILESHIKFHVCFKLYTLLSQSNSETHLLEIILLVLLIINQYINKSVKCPHVGFGCCGYVVSYGFSWVFHVG
jgi:hypothetical protein